jgi:hypothetical protein
MVNQLLETSHPASLSALRLRASARASSSIFRTLFQVPYPVTPLLATLTKTMGGGGHSSHFGTHLGFPLDSSFSCTYGSPFCNPFIFRFMQEWGGYTPLWTWYTLKLYSNSNARILVSLDSTHAPPSDSYRSDFVALPAAAGCRGRMVRRPRVSPSHPP